MKPLNFLLPAALGLLAPAAYAQANDNFAGAIPIPSGLPQTIENQNNAGATAEMGEPDHGVENIASHSLWYTYTPTADTAISISVLDSSSDLDTIISVYTGTSLSDLTLFSDIDLQRIGEDETLITQVKGGTTYFIAVDSFLFEQGDPAATGTYKLTAEEVQIPSNDLFAQATIVPAPLPQTIMGDNRAASIEAGEPVHGATSSTKSERSLWYSYTPSATTNLNVTITPVDESQESLLSVYRGTSLADLALVSELELTSLEGLTDEEQEEFQQSLNVSVTAGAQYFIAVNPLGEDPGFATSGPYDITFKETTLTPPANDSITAATPLGDTSPVSTTGSTIGATTEAGDPTTFNGSTNVSSQNVWYTWTPPTGGAGTYNINAESFNATPYVVLVATGTPTNLTTLNSIASPTGRSRADLQFAAVVGTTYYIMVDGFSDGTLQFSDEFDLGICLSPENDNFDSATDLGSAPVVMINDDSSCASYEVNEPDHGASPFASQANTSLWYTWEAPAMGRWEITLTNSNFNYIIAVYEGSTLDELSLVSAAGIEDAMNGDNLTLDATTGTVYHIAVEGDGEGGPFTLNLNNLDPLPTVTPEVMAFTADPASQQFTIEFASESGQPYSLKASPDLIDWSIEIDDNILGAAGESTTFSFSDLGAPNPGKRFYRVERN